MSKCCINNPFDLGCVTCDVTNILIESAEFTSDFGDWYVHWHFNNRIIKEKLTYSEGANPELNLSNRNEDYLYTGQIIKPSGEIFTWTHESVEYDGFKLKIKYIS